ncbi:hypothetical protein D9613_009993 [Agrocybe pediades]|uniref:Nuclear condensin complex subunit 3 C-terminal domain-containing protein n=1 Tax=Agrocybe pediades TaxID=84607 RepID=A0A8H4QXJ0_9AGAR|nr:hypothetical protein D9613_009993 [Agrocybe pediades]
MLNEAKSKQASSSSQSEEDDDTPSSRFVARLLNWHLQGFEAKNKIVRYRCMFIISEMISHLGEIDEDAYKELRDALIQRLNDKETIIRTHAVIALAKLVESEDPDELEDGQPTILQTLLDTVVTDPAPEVRRAALLNVPLTPATIDTILTRTRDVDAVTRKLVYTGVLQSKLEHPRQLSIAQREQIVKDGLGDREPAVRVAAGKLVASWLDLILGESEKAPSLGWDGDDGGVMKGLVHFLGLFDVVGPGEAVAVDAVLSIFTTRPDVTDVFAFPDTYWKELTPESTVLARVFVEHCVSSKNEARIETSSLPVVTAFAFHIQEAYNNLLSVLEEIETSKMLRASAEEENEDLEEELAKREVILSELLRTTLKLDYGDEIGRRKVFSVVKDMLAHPQLPPGLIDRCLDVLKEIMPSERDLIRVIVEIVVELREGDEDAENADDAAIDDNQSDVSQSTSRKEKASRKKDRQDLSPEERIKADITDIRCLMLCIAMLERVNGTFEDNSTLEGILGDLIIPSVKRKEIAMREKALVSLGLCCLIAKNMALSSFQLFLNQAQNAPPELQVQVLRIIMDLLIMYDQEFFGRSEETAKQIVDFLLQVLEAEEVPEAQAVLATGFCKLLLAGIVNDGRILTALALLYISPTTTDNQELRQCLAYFFPVYSYSSPANQNRMQSIFMPTYDLAVRMHEELDEDQEMITPYQFGLLMVDWTNPEKAAEVGGDGGKEKPSHVKLAVEIAIALYDSNRTPDEQKSLCQLLGQLHITPGLGRRSIHKLNIVLSNHEDQAPFENSAIERIFDRFKNKISSMFEKEAKEIDPQEYIDEEFRDIYQRIGVDVPGEGDDGKARSRARGKRRAQKDEEEEQEKDQEEEENNDEEDEVIEEEEAVEEEDAVEQDQEENDDEAKPSDDEHADAKAVEEDHVEDEAEEEEQEDVVKSPTPPPSKRGRKPPGRTSSRTTKATTRGRKVYGFLLCKARSLSEAYKHLSVPQEEPETQASDAENIPPPVDAPSTPKKKKGRKRAQSPSEAVKSPANRKRTRVKAPLKSAAAESDSGNESPTPKKSTRQTRARGAKEEIKSKATWKSKSKAAPPRPVTPEAKERKSSDEEADEVAESLAGSPLSALPSSDDFGGYSD